MSHWSKVEYDITSYQPLKLMQVVTGKVNEICLRYRDNGKLATLPPPSPGPPISSCAIKNTRRRMEDRHDRSPTSYYAVFDGHAGTDAAVYSNLRSGTTAVCALLRHKEKMLYVAWLGDSQAVLVREGTAVQVVTPHKPDRKDERERIEDMGGCVLYWGTWRVNGQLAVSRAIGMYYNLRKLHI
ncbi:Protein phosphatase 1E [Blattella germanica]|nr:Protein phosphatase 1E [Blattella germanica]